MALRVEVFPLSSLPLVLKWHRRERTSVRTVWNQAGLCLGLCERGAGLSSYESCSEKEMTYLACLLCYPSSSYAGKRRGSLRKSSRKHQESPFRVPFISPSPVPKGPPRQGGVSRTSWAGPLRPSPGRTPPTQADRHGGHPIGPLSPSSELPDGIVFPVDKSTVPFKWTEIETNTSPESDKYLRSSVLLFSVLPAECVNGRAKLCSGKSESQELINRLDTCLCEELLKPEILFVTAIHLLHRFLIQIFFLLEPRLRKQPILWKDLFNKKRIKLSVLNKVDHCETWVKSHREEYVRLTALYNKTAFNSWHGSFCCSKGEAAKAGARAQDIILKYCSLWNFSSERCQESELYFDLWLL